MKVKIKDIPQKQRYLICRSIPLEHCCTPVCPLSEEEGKCACYDQCVEQSSPEFEEKEIEVDL